MSQNLPSGHRARKRFGQNFLVDEGIIAGIVAAIRPQPEDHLVEIGPGQGALTAPLLAKHPQLDVVELDRDLVPVLLAQFANYREFRLHRADALKFDFTHLVPDKPLRIVGNLPYNISTPLIFRLLDLGPRIQDMHFMLQREVVARLTAPTDSGSYGRLSVMTQVLCESEKLIDVPPESFHPAPKVQSAVVRLRPKPLADRPKVDLNILDRVVKAAFAQRRKTLRNALRDIVDAERAERLELNLGLRAENLSPDTYIRIATDIETQPPEYEDTP